MIVPLMMVQGGAGDIPDSRDAGKFIGCKLATRTGYDKLISTGCVLTAVEEAVKVMELDGNFNAGKMQYKFHARKRITMHIIII